MTTVLLSEYEVNFLLYEFLGTDKLLKRSRYQEHSREIFDGALRTAQVISQKFFSNHFSKGDVNEPKFDGKNVHLIPETQIAWDAVADAGLMAAHQNFSEGGMQMPALICSACQAYLNAGNAATAGYPFLTMGACNLIRSFGGESQKALYVPPMMDGRFAGTMALTEADQGSSLADIKTKATPCEDGTYRIKGQKMFITNGDHNLTENIIHLVLAKIEGAPSGINGISLFIVPKVLVNPDGSLGERNDIALAGLLHKMGYRNATSTVLSFGEKNGAIGYLLGEPHLGLRYMFQMMNEARIGVGLAAAVIAYQGYQHALAYARQRPQGRAPSNRDPSSKQVLLIEHADVRRMLLAQKAYAEGALALCLYATSLVEDTETAPSKEERNKASLLLDVLTPIVKSWPSKYGCKSNDLAIQVLGGAGYIREYPVEQLYRDQRLNPIHEGTEGIQALDLMGRKLCQHDGQGIALLIAAIDDTVSQASQMISLQTMAEYLDRAKVRLQQTSDIILQHIEDNADRGLSNASCYLDFSGSIVIAWIWLKQALVSAQNLDRSAPASQSDHYYLGKIHTAKYFIECELPKTIQQAELLESNNQVTFEMQDRFF
ncbi:acyl-CoA dehydrogenase [SAR92 clade bacterium H246]